MRRILSFVVASLALPPMARGEASLYNPEIGRHALPETLRVAPYQLPDLTERPRDAGRGLAEGEHRLQPEHEVWYHGRVLDATTNQPVPNLTVRATEIANLTRCSEQIPPSNCTNCYSESWTRHGIGSTDEAGKVDILFLHEHCDQVSTDPPEWDSSLHLTWGAPEIVVPAPTPEGEFLIDRVVSGPYPFTQTIYILRENVLAERFAPVLHRHRALERQADLGDCESALGEASGTYLTGVSPDGRALYARHRTPPLHVWDPNLTWDSFGLRWGHHDYWGLDLLENFRNAGAPIGERPVYYHVFPFDQGAVVQYWFWFNANDVPPEYEEGFRVFHEGDWEHIAIYLERVGTDWQPDRVNFHQHVGGSCATAEECWWSPTNVASYVDLRQGYTPDAEHLHVWLAANSHSTYNRFEPFYRIEVSEFFDCHGVYTDLLDYNPGNSARGAHGFFEYDRLVPMGEVWSEDDVHGGSWSFHLRGNGPEFLQFSGRFGEAGCALSDSCPGLCDNPFWKAWQPAPLSPAMPEVPHNWLDFHLPVERWGNDGGPFAHVSWIEAPTHANYLGAFRSCGGAAGDSITVRIAGGEGVPGIARVSVLAGDPVLSGLDDRLCQSLDCGGDGRYTFHARADAGEGEVRVDVFRDDGSEECLAEDLRLEVWSENCGTSKVDTHRARDSAPRLSVIPNPARGVVRLVLSTAAVGTETLSVFDLAGRRVWHERLTPGLRELNWSIAPGPRSLPTGSYVVRLTRSNGAESLRFTLLK